jgi:hypothetical protein
VHFSVLPRESTASAPTVYPRQLVPAVFRGSDFPHPVSSAMARRSAVAIASI